MNKKEILEKISQKNFDRDYFVRFINNDSNIREFIVNELLLNNDIMIYYHCYYVVSEASKKEPSLYYKYWDKIVELLDHDNSYHRDIGLTLIANLVKVDDEDRFSLIWPRFIEHINDKKFMTGKCCLNNIRVILKTRLDLIDEVVTRLLNIDKICHYNEKQIALLECDVLNIFDDVFLKNNYMNEIVYFIKKKTSSISPKTRKKAKQLIRKYKI
ncbi:hypothetical protein GM661_11790 [Iocasia frigidifontis]|uniref:Uncharacterized protein n=1 Tax=Iocasia fonsfrigidae TaxID=2682810 RepID=A0A8A7KES9_9FIRM|nr:MULTISPECIES: hypothetical protein [Halanaerobiaceae]AZO95735.1 hypothetical protein D7D81_14710 [Halocella sp. SP3-1]QTL98595.1 hypothetical protein GM661_11790 [Iocasia fonsfrigidae]